MLQFIPRAMMPNVSVINARRLCNLHPRLLQYDLDETPMAEAEKE